MVQWKMGPSNSSYTPEKLTLTLESQLFEDVSPIKNGDFPLSF